MAWQGVGLKEGKEGREGGRKEGRAAYSAKDVSSGRDSSTEAS